MPKFRTMYVDTPDIATHLLEDDKYQYCWLLLKEAKS